MHIQKYRSKLNFSDLSKLILNCLNKMQGQEIICINIDKKYNSITDLMIICTGQSTRHTTSIAENILYKLRHIGFIFYKIEGIRYGEWILIDLGNIMVHIMKQDTRELYALEKLWN